MLKRSVSIFYLCLILFSSVLYNSAVRAENAYILTSLKLSEKEKKYIEDQFADSLNQAPYNLIVKHYVGPSILLQALRDPSARAIIWISHTASSTEKGSAIFSDDIILDYWGNDIKNFFKNLPSKLIFLGVVGCNAKSIFERYKNKGYYKNHENLKVESFEEKITLKAGLKKTLKSAAKYLIEEVTVSPSQNDDKQAFSELNMEEKIIEIQYRAYGYGSGWLEFDGQVIGFFWIENGKTIFPQLSIKKQDWENSSNKNLKYFRNKEYQYHNIDNIKFESIKFHKREWKNFKNSKGKSFGGNDQRLFIFE